jgi:hypothetical protein
VPVGGGPPYDGRPVSDVSDQQEVGWRFSRVGALSGVAYAILAFVGSSLLPIGEVDPTQTAEVIAEQVAEARGRVSGGILLTLMSLFFLLVFVAWLYSWLRHVEGRAGWLPTLALMGGALMVAMSSVVVLLSIAGTVLEDYGADPQIARTLLVLQWQSLAVMFIPTAAFVGATGAVIYRSEVLPRWLAYGGMIIAFGLLIPPIAFLPYLLSTLWIGMLAVVLLQRSRYG